MTIIYVALFILTLLFIVANAVDPPKVRPWVWGIVMALWLALLTFAGK
jgi:hypothetical protein